MCSAALRCAVATGKMAMSAPHSHPHPRHRPSPTMLCLPACPSPPATRCRALFFNTGRVQSSSLPEKMALPADEKGDIVCETKGNVRAIHGLYVAGGHCVCVCVVSVRAARRGPRNAVPVQAVWMLLCPATANALPAGSHLAFTHPLCGACLCAGNCAAAPLKLVMTAASQGAITGAKVNSGKTPHPACRPLFAPAWLACLPHLCLPAFA